MKIRGKLISSFGAVTLVILLVYSFLVYTSFTESLRQDRVSSYQHQTEAAIVSTELLLWQQIFSVLHSNKGDNAQTTTQPVITSYSIINQTPDKTLPCSYLARQVDIPLPASWCTGELEDHLVDGPQLLIAQGRTVILWLTSKQSEKICYLFEVDYQQLMSLLREKLLLSDTRLFFSRDNTFSFDLADPVIPPPSPLSEITYDLLIPQGINNSSLEKGLYAFQDSLYQLSSETSLFGLHLDYVLPKTIFLQELIRLKNRVIAATIILAWVAVWVILIIAYSFSKPIVKLVKVVNDMIAFKYQTPFEFVPSNDEIGELSKSFETMRQEIESLVTKDPLTKTYNRRFLMHIFKVNFSKAKRSNEKLACIILDIDFFKKVNDSYGHQAGDDVLQSVGKILMDSVRIYDTVSTVARFGGEEFVILLPGEGGEGGIKVAERIREKVKAYPMAHNIRCTISLGIAALGPHHETPDMLLAEADQALYQAKESGRDQSILFKIK